jgi:hypothetical protein
MSAALACTLDQHDLALRRARWTRLVSAALHERTPHASGVRLRFHGSAAVEAELDELIRSERECCSFATWSLQRAGDDVLLEVSAPPSAVAAVYSLFEECG